MEEIICSQGHVIGVGRDTCSRCNSRPVPSEVPEVEEVEESPVEVPEKEEEVEEVEKVVEEEPKKKESKVKKVVEKVKKVLKK